LRSSLKSAANLGSHSNSLVWLVEVVIVSRQIFIQDASSSVIVTETKADEKTI
jgi:hypothetical protein